MRTPAEIRAAKATGKVGIILGWQNTSGIDDDAGNLVLFRDLGVRVIRDVDTGNACHVSLPINPPNERKTLNFIL